MARGTTVSTGLTHFVGNLDAGSVPHMKGTGTKLAVGYTGSAASGAITMIGDIQKSGGTPPTGSSFGTALPQSDVIKSAFLLKTTAATPTDVTSKATITADNQVTLTGLAASASLAWLYVVFEEADKMGAAE